MTMIRPETEMKDSGIQWLGNIPKEWSIIKGKYILKQLSRSVLESDNVVTCFRDGEVTLRSNRRELGFTNSLKEIGYQGVEPGDLVVHGMDGFAGAIGISDSRGKMSPIINVLESGECKKYLMYYLRGLAFVNVFLGLSTGIRERSCDLRWNKLANLEYTIPPLSEQQAVANYLDKTCSKIDEIIAEAKASIDEYKELKQSILFETMTRGIQSDRKYKTCDYEWLGKVPEDWSLMKITHILDDNDSYPIGDGDHGLIKTDSYKSEGIPYIRVQNIGWGTPLLMDNVVYISKEDNERIKGSQLKPGDVLFVKTGATIGKTAIVPNNIPISNTTSHVGKITVSKEHNSKYIFYLLSSFIGYKQFWDIACMKATRPELSISEIKQMKVLIPSTRDEEDEIVEYLDNKLPEYETLICIKESLINDLEAYKKSLIYEVVTGKRRVV
mgnify:CR=1 FL=1